MHLSRLRSGVEQWQWLGFYVILRPDADSEPI